jgi:hypothetical protein
VAVSFIGVIDLRHVRRTKAPINSSNGTSNFWNIRIKKPIYSVTQKVYITTDVVSSNPVSLNGTCARNIRMQGASV